MWTIISTSLLTIFKILFCVWEIFCKCFEILITVGDGLFKDNNTFFSNLVYMAIELFIALSVSVIMQQIATSDRESENSIVSTENETKPSQSTQTCGPWQKRTRKQERQYLDTKMIVHMERAIMRRNKNKFTSKMKLKYNNLRNENESKAKLLAAVKARVVCYALENDNLMNRIQEERRILDNQRLTNRDVADNYESLSYIIQKNNEIIAQY